MGIKSKQYSHMHETEGRYQDEEQQDEQGKFGDISAIQVNMNKYRTKTGGKYNVDDKCMSPNKFVDGCATDAAVNRNIDLECRCYHHCCCVATSSQSSPYKFK